MKTIDVDIFNKESIRAAERELRRYAENLKEIEKKIQHEIAVRLESMISSGFNGAPYDDIIGQGTRPPNVSVQAQDKNHYSVVIAYGKEAVFVEFGAGVYYNPAGSPHPERPPGIVEIGEYGHGYGKRKVWGFYTSENGSMKLVKTRGTPASAPMYHSVQAILEEIPDIVKSIFNSESW